jgi:RNA polymerase sigma factor (TIGR02999 family)
MDPATPLEVTSLLRRAKDGDANAMDRLVPLVYDELRALASRHLGRERAGHTLQTTALANEAWLRLAGQEDVEWSDRAQFFGLAATFIRRILVDHARSRGAAKRGGEARRVPLEEGLVYTQEGSDELLCLDGALDRLAQVDARKARIVELRFFAGLSIAEAADVVGVSHTTVEKDWAFARVWLRREIDG